MKTEYVLSPGQKERLKQIDEIIENLLREKAKIYECAPVRYFLNNEERERYKKGMGIYQMADDFILELEDYCSFCGDFEPDVGKFEAALLGANACRYIATIKCQNAYKCARIKLNMVRDYDIS